VFEILLYLISEAVAKVKKKDVDMIGCLRSVRKINKGRDDGPPSQKTDDPERIQTRLPSASKRHPSEKEARRCSTWASKAILNRQ
jgi:hypothetical protein